MEISEKLKRELDILEYKATAHATDYDMIFSLYKYFINSDAAFYTSGCSCRNSIEKYYNELITWWKNYKLQELNNGNTKGQNSQVS
jgi:hypothetical protein